MLEGFSKISLMSGAAFMSITDNGTSFNKNVVAKMNRPTHICLMFNEKERKLAIQACDEEDHDAIPFLKKNGNAKNGVRFNNRELQSNLAEMMEWDISSYNYRMDGVYDSTERAMIFDLNEARKLPKKNMMKK